VSAAATPLDDPASGFGATLAMRLAELRRRNLTIGVREETEAHALAAELLARRVVRDFGEFEPYLAALLCRSEADYSAFAGQDVGTDPPFDFRTTPAPTRFARLRGWARNLSSN